MFICAHNVVMNAQNFFANNKIEVKSNNLPLKNQVLQVSSAATTPFGNLTTSVNKSLSNIEEEMPHGETFDGFDTDILSDSRLKKIDNTTVQLEVKIARLRAELEEHKKLVESTFLKSDKAHYQKLLEIQKRMEAEIQRLVAEYQNRQLKSIVFSPFAKLFHFIKSYVALR